MFDYAKIKAELEEVKCSVHDKAATVVLADGRITFENVCCDEHRKQLEDMLPEVDFWDVSDILEDVYY
jgi:hypothetical protein